MRKKKKVTVIGFRGEIVDFAEGGECDEKLLSHVCC